MAPAISAPASTSQESPATSRALATAAVQASKRERFSPELLRDAQTYFEAKLGRTVSLQEAEVFLVRLRDFGAVLQVWK